MKAKLFCYFFVLTILSLFFAPASVLAGPASPFVGNWQAIDVDGSDIRLTIAGPPNGPFNITWTESYISFCNGGPGIVRGQGQLAEDDPYILEAELVVECFNTGESLEFSVTWIYDPGTDTIAYPEPDPVIMTWHRPGKPIPLEWRTVIAHPDQDWVEGGGYPEGTYVSIRIYDSSGTLLFGETGIASYREGDPNFWVEFNVGYDLKTGDHVWMTDGKNAKDLIVTNLQITGTNLTNHTLSGIGEPGTQVIIEYAPKNVYFLVEVDRDGNWTATVEEMEPFNSILVSQEDDDGDLTRLALDVPNTRFVVFPEWEWFDGLEWPDGAIVSISVEGKPECSLVKESWGGFFNGAFPEGCDLAIGDTVSFTDDFTTSTHTVRNLAITAVDKEANTISGTADPETLVYVWPHDAWFEPLQATADESGAWQVDLDDVGYDILEEAAGRSEIRDEAGNATAVDWYVPPPPPLPFIWVDPVSEYINGWNWPVGNTVTVDVFDPENTLVYSASQEAQPDSGVGFDVYEAGLDLQPGFRVTMSDGFTNKEIVVSSLQITDIDQVARVISGTYDASTNLGFWINLSGRQPESLVFDGENWSATFAEFIPGEWGEVAQPDENGDMTGFSFMIPF